MFQIMFLIFKDITKDSIYKYYPTTEDLLKLVNLLNLGLAVMQ